jgi:hypothetical protein
MKESQQPVYRLCWRFGFYDLTGSNLWHEWPEGAIVSDPTEIALLRKRGAPIERINA